MSTMPLVLYPTILLWIDDDELFLQAVTEGFKNNYPVRKFISPSDCIEYFQKYQATTESISFFRGCREHEEYDLNDHLPVDLNFNNILKLRDNQQRFKDVAVMIVDYNMPGNISGIDLCRELHGHSVKKILLTGEASDRQGVNAFNDGIIDCFIRKDELALTTDLLSYIQKLHIQYFVDMTKPLLTHLEADYKLPQSDPIFINFFYDWCRNNEIIEYYLIDKNGTFLTINKDGHAKYFLTHTDRSLETFTELYQEDKEVSSFAQSVIQRKKIPFFGINKEPWNFEFSDWINYFHEPKVLEGRERYYWNEIDLGESH